MKSKYLFCFIQISLGLILQNPIAAEEIYVQADPSSDSRPLNDAINKAAASDVLIIEPGIYTEHIIVDKALTIRGTPGSVMSGSKKFLPKWKKAPDMPGVYMASLKKRIRGLLVDGKFIAELRFKRVQKKGDWYWKKLLKKGPPHSGFQQIQALWTYEPQAQQLYARFENGQDPAHLNITFLPNTTPLIHINGADKVIIEGLTFEQCSSAIRIDNQARNCIIQKCKISSFESTGIILSGGASNCRIENCDIARGAFEQWSPSPEQGKANYEIWQIHKNAGNYDRNAINLIRSGSGNQIIGNHLHHVFDGITIGDYKLESLDIPLKNPQSGRDTIIANNVIEHTRDSGIELGVGSINVHVHHNLLRQSHGGLRFKLPRIGPIYIHHNRLIAGSPFNLWFSMDASPAEAYVYHNTVIGGRSFLLVSRQSLKRNFISPKWHFLNNLSLNNEGFCSPETEKILDFTASHNITSGTARPWPTNQAKDRGSLYQVVVKHDQLGKPKPGSATIDAGLDLSTYLDGKALPGCEAGYFKGKAPDVGADEIK